MKERDCKNTSLHYRNPFPDLPLIAVQSSLIMHCQGQSSRDSNGVDTRDMHLSSGIYRRERCSMANSKIRPYKDIEFKNSIPKMLPVLFFGTEVRGYNK